MVVSRGIEQASNPGPRGEPPWVGLSLMPDDAFLRAAAPLFAAQQVDAVEWSFDTGWDTQLPVWLEGLLAEYGDAGRLFGHGVHFSMLSASWEPRQQEWLDSLGRELTRRQYVHISEHYGFMTSPPFVRGAPLPAPRGDALLSVGRDRLRRLRERVVCPVGLENLALAFSRDEALAHGTFLGALLQEKDFIVLDLHNLYCQAANFEIDPVTLLQTYPLDRVRELHVSGGSWQPAWQGETSATVRCDTHDGPVPELVFDLLRAALERCPNLRLVILEQLGHALRSERQAAQFRADFCAVRATVEARTSAPLAAPSPPASELANHEAGAWSHATVSELASLQSGLMRVLHSQQHAADVRRQLRDHPAFVAFSAQVDDMDDRALGIAARVVQRWARARDSV